METKLIYQLINTVSAVLIGVCGVLGFINSVANDFSFSGMIINVYYVAFALLFLVIAFRSVDLIETQMQFLYNFIGRGLTYLLFGLLFFRYSFTFELISSIFLVIVSIIYIIQYFKKAEPEF